MPVARPRGRPFLRPDAEHRTGFLAAIAALELPPAFLYDHVDTEGSPLRRTSARSDQRTAG